MPTTAMVLTMGTRISTIAGIIHTIGTTTFIGIVRGNLRGCD